MLLVLFFFLSEELSRDCSDGAVQQFVLLFTNSVVMWLASLSASPGHSVPRAGLSVPN